MINKIKNRIPIFDIKKQYEILKDEDVSGRTKKLVIFTLSFSILYFILPFDIIPDVLLGFGYLDDLAIYSILREIVYKSAKETES